jgi:hypothetical protein
MKSFPISMDTIPHNKKLRGLSSMVADRDTLELLLVEAPDRL